MKAPETISRLPPQSASMQFDTLLKQGVAACQQLGGDLWTDFNEHDPGVTILEQLCFAITELGFRANYPIEELLAPSLLAARTAKSDAGSASAPAAPEQRASHTLFTGDRILSCAPLTFNDYRKLLYDETENLKNAWLQTVDASTHPFGASGQLRVLVETFGEEMLEDDEDEPTQKKNLLERVSELIHKNRNLGEDLAEIKVLKPCEFTVAATVELQENADPVYVLAQILYNIQFDLVPFPKVSPIAPRMAQGEQPDRLYVGPRLGLGLIGDADLSAKCSSVSVEALYRIMLGVEGVKSVRDVRINDGDDPLVIAPYDAPRLKPSIFSRQQQQDFAVVLERNGARVPFDSDLVRHRIARLFAKLKKQEVFLQEQVESADYIRLPTSDSPQVGNYYSVQHHFPATYGIGRFGGIASARGENSVGAKLQRGAQTHQLQAYLLFFEQVLANGAAQLADAWRLFELERDLDRSYFCQPVVTRTDDGTEPPGMLAVLAATPAAPTPTEQVRHVVYVNATDRHAEILLRSREFDKLEQAQAARLQILAAAVRQDRYRLLPLPSGEYGLILDDGQGQGLAFAGARFDSEGAARREIARIATFLREVGQDSRQLARRIAIEAKGIYGVKLLDERGGAILAVEHLTRHMQQWSAQALLEYGADSAHYRIRRLKSGDFILVLYAPHTAHEQAIAQGMQRFSSEHNAHIGRQAAAQLVRRLRAEPQRQAAQLLRLPLAFADAQDGVDTLTYHAQQLDVLVRDFDDFLERRNRFLNHLLARFGERFDDAALQRFDPAPNPDRPAFLRDLVGWKIDFLQQCVHFGADRNLGVDLSLLGKDSSAARSVLEQRLACLLGISESGGTATPGFEYRSGAALAQVLDERQFTFVSERPDLAQALLRYGVRRENYQVEKNGHGKPGVYVKFSWPNQSNNENDGYQAAEERAVYRAADEREAEAAIDALVQALSDYPKKRSRLYAGEEMRLLEHILLLPQAKSGAPSAAELKPVAALIDWGSHQWTLTSDAPDAGELLLLALDPIQHRIVVAGRGQHYLQLHDRHGRIVARNARRHSTHRHAQHALREFLSFLRKIAQPEIAQAAAQEPADGDFYSHRISLLLPDWPIRMQNLEFRKFVQRTLDENCPAHLAAQCYWLNAAQMTEFKRLHAVWAPLRSKYADQNALRSMQDKAGVEVDRLNSAAAALRGFMRARIEESAHAAADRSGS